MAITKLMHMKQSEGCPYVHLKNAIDYILDVKHNGEKTKYGELVGGNCGVDSVQVLQTMLETKGIFGKPDGRQGYHFVISFAKGETDEATAYAVVNEFCEEYLGDRYDYVFAIHVDKGHLHGHIIFNSVSRVDGYKYHYKEGDWAKYIQPVTDRVTAKHGLDPLIFDEEEKVGVPYASWAAEKEGKLNWSHIIRSDVDYAVQHASSMEEFKELLNKMNYSLRLGRSRKRNANYFTYRFTDENGKCHSRRSYQLPAGYGPEEIARRIRTKGGPVAYEDIMQALNVQAGAMLKSSVSIKNTRTYHRLYQAVNYYKLPNPFAVPAYQVRSDMLRVEQLIEECRVIKEEGITKPTDAEKQAKILEEQRKHLCNERSRLYGIYDSCSDEVRQEMKRYSELMRQLSLLNPGDDSFEKIEDELTMLRKNYPAELLETESRIHAVNNKLREFKKKQRIMQRIAVTEMQTTPQQTVIRQKH